MVFHTILSYWGPAYFQVRTVSMLVLGRVTFSSSLPALQSLEKPLPSIASRRPQKAWLSSKANSCWENIPHVKPTMKNQVIEDCYVYNSVNVNFLLKAALQWEAIVMKFHERGKLIHVWNGIWDSWANVKLTNSSNIVPCLLHSKNDLWRHKAFHETARGSTLPSIEDKLGLYLQSFRLSTY